MGRNTAAKGKSNSTTLHYESSFKTTESRTRAPRTSYPNRFQAASLQLEFKVSHIYREGNTVADALANYGALNAGYSW
ncbi:hypothetical protein ACLB2K_035695 [Fragaria x ananassa]